MQYKFIATLVFFAATYSWASDKLTSLSERLACESLSTTSACGKVGETRKWNYARAIMASAKRYNASSTLDGVLKGLNLPDSPESAEKIKTFLTKSEEIISSQRAQLEAAHLEKQAIEKKFKSATTGNEFAAVNKKIEAIQSSLHAQLRDLEIKQFGKLNLTSTHSPANVFSQYAIDDFNFEAAKKGFNTGAKPLQESYIQSQRQTFGSIMRATRQNGFSMKALGRAAGGSVLAIASAGAFAGNVALSTSLIVNCAKELDVKLSSEDFFQLSRYAYTLKGSQTETKNCEAIQFNPYSIETLTEAKMMTPEMKKFFEKFHDVVQKRQDQVFSQPNLKFSCKGITWDNVNVDIEDSKLVVRSDIEGKKLNTEISWNAVNEWDYMTITSDDPNYKQYLDAKVRSLTPNSSTGRTAQRLQISVQQSCQSGLQGTHDKARCDTAKAIALWNQFSVEHQQGCKKDDATKSSSHPYSDSNPASTEVPTKQ